MMRPGLPQRSVTELLPSILRKSCSSSFTKKIHFPKLIAWGTIFSLPPEHGGSMLV